MNFIDELIRAAGGGSDEVGLPQLATAPAPVYRSHQHTCPNHGEWRCENSECGAGDFHPCLACLLMGRKQVLL